MASIASVQSVFKMVKEVSNNFRFAVSGKVMVTNKHAYAISSENLNPYTLRAEFYIIPAAVGGPDWR
jgi:hypothetical protein